MLNKQTVINTLRKQRPQLASNYHVSEIGLFGSFAKGQETPDSDIDLLLEFEGSQADLYTLKNELRQHLSELFNRKVEIARKRYLKPYARERILNEVIYVD